jgi:hypothetical protein
VHRFLYLKDDKTFITKGDKTLEINQPVDNDSLIGKVVLVDKKIYSLI